MKTYSPVRSMKHTLAVFAMAAFGLAMHPTQSVAAAITYAQGNYATPQAPQTSVSVTFAAAQTAGDLNVVAVGWNDSTATVSTVVDKSGNTYARAVGPTVVSGVASQSIYYAKNIVAAAAGANVVTVTFSSAAVYPDIRILEYKGADINNPVDVTAASSGNSATSSSGSVTTTNATDLLFGANLVVTTTSGPGSGFTQRLMTSPDGDIAEDEMVAATGSYSATAPLGSGQWIMQMVALRAPSGGTNVPTVTGVSPNTGSTAGGTSVTITGANFATGATVKFGSTAATNVVEVSGTSITATTPSGSAGAVTVTVTIGGQSGSLASGFTYVATPTVTSVSPNTGTTAGGTAVTISGTNFVTGATVKFGPTAATNVVVVSSTSITATTPAGSAGAVTVTVTVSGQSGSLTNGFTYVVVPTVTGVSPNTGTTAGGTAVTIAGTNFASGATVKFGSTAATNVVVVSGTSITATTPAGSAGAVTVAVTIGGQSGSLASGFTYVATPTVTSVSPNTGTTAGGTTVTISGANFVAGATVKFGPTAATNVVVVSSTSITATTPAGSAGAVTVTVTVSGQSGSLTNGFTYVVVPTVTGVSPNAGTTAGGTAVTITGTNFAAGATVNFGSTAASNVVVTNATSITATTPAGSAGAVNVTVTANGQSGSLANGFTYVAIPTVTSMAPSTGPTGGGTSVTIAGTNFVSGATVKFGSTAATSVTVVSSTSITATTPAGTVGAVTVTVTVSGQSGSLSNAFTYVVAPTVTSVSPSSGPAAGGTSVTITGTNFASGASVTFGSTAATNVVVNSSTSVTATTPAGGAGAVTVIVTVNGQSGSLSNSFTYVGLPTVTGVSPNSGSTAGGTPVTISGTNFATGATVTFGSIAASNVVVVNGTTITATTPGGSSGAVTVTVTNPASQSGSIANGFTYLLSTTITYVQGNYATPQSPQTGVSITFASAQAAGDLNVITIGWNDSVATISTVTDKSGNTYTLAVGPTILSGVASQAIYYAKNIVAAAAGANSVTVTFSSAAGYPDIRVLEYKGADPNNPVDVTAASSGNSATSSSGSVATTNATDLLFGANLVLTTTSGPGSGFTSRLLTSPDGDIAEDEMVTASGSYSATAPLSSGQWIMQMVAFRTPASGGDTTPPTAPTNLTAAASGTQINLSWTASTDNVGVTGYRVERCQGAGCTNFVQIATPTTTSYSDTALGAGSYSYRVRATDAAGNLSTYSNTATGAIPDTTPPSAPTNLTATDASTTQINLSWTASTDNVGLTGYLLERCQGAGCSNFAQIATPTAATYSDAGLTTNSTYSYRVRATDAAGNLSQYSNTATASTVVGTPTAPTNATAVDGGPVPTVVAVQSYYNSTFFTSHTTASFNSTGGDLIVIAASSHSGVILTPSDSFGNTWIPIAGPTNTSAGSFDLRTQLWYAQNPIVGPNHTVTMGLSAAQPLVISVIVVKGSNISDPIDVVSLIGSDNGTQTINIVSPTVTTARANDLLVGFAKVSSGATFQAGAGFTQQAAASSNFLDAETGPAATPGSYAATFTIDSQQNWESAVVAVANNPNQTTLSWTASTETGGTISQYLVERCQGSGCSTFAQVGTTASTTYGDPGLTASTSYSYRVRAEDAANNLGPYSTVVTIATPGPTPSIPSAPGNLIASGPIAIAGQSYIGGSPATSHTTATFDSTRGDLIVLAASSFANVTFTPTDNFGNTWIPIAGPTSTTTGSDLRTEVFYAPNPVVGPGHTVTVNLSTAEALAMSVTVVQGANPSSPIDSVSTINSDNGTQTTTVASPSITTTSMNDLLIGFAQVSAGAGFLTGSGFTDIGESSSSYLTTEAGPAATPGTYATTFLLNGNQTWLSAAVAVVNTSNQVTLSWAPSAETGGNVIGGSISNYLVERCQGTGCTNFAQIGTTTGTSFTDTGLSASASYSYRVRAEDTASTFGPYSSVVTVVPSGSLPSAPGNLTAGATGQGPVLLTWNASTGGVGIASYTIQRCQGTGCSNFAQVGTSTGTTYTDSTVVAGTTDTYRVQAVDSAGTLSPFSNNAIVTTSGPPTAPGNLTATATSPTQINLSWIASGSSIGLANYVVQRCQGAGCNNFAQIATPVSTTYTDAGLLAGTSYSYRVEAIDIVGNLSPFSNIASATTQSSGSTTIAYAQGAYTTPQSSQTSVSVAFSGAQAAGDLNVVVVGWNNSTATVTAVTDTKGNQYALAVGPTIQSPVASQSIYYAKNILAAGAGANTITVAFSSAAAYPDIRILEYTGADPSNPVDTVAAATGNSSISSAGPVTTNNATDLLFAANLVQTVTSGAGTGFTARLLTAPDADIAEDQMVTTVGSYTASAPLSAGQWIMQMVAFRAAGFCSSAPPTTPGSLTAAPTSSSQMNLRWTASTSCVGVAHYVVQRCQGASCTNFTTVANPTATTFVDSGLAANISYSYQVQAVDTSGSSSSFSNIASATTLAISISPRFTDVTFTQTQQFTSSAGVNWSVDGVAGGSATSGTVSSTGLYIPPSAVGTHTVTATTSDLHSASATVYVTNYPGTYTYHNDNLRTGQNLNETTLTVSNVNQNQFGKLFSYPLDGIALASPLYVANVSISGQGYHNVVYVATEHDSISAFDADGLSTTPLWHVSFLGSGVTSVPCADVGGCGDIATEIGITGTPVIDAASGTIYMVAKTKEGAQYVQRLHALDITSGAEKFGGPVVLQASVPGTGTGSSGGNVAFDPLLENQRPALLLNGATIYIAFGSHNDVAPWHGWVLGYNATTLQQTMKYNATANGNGGGIWQGGGGLATDTTGDIYFVTSNGDFDANTAGIDYGDSVEKLSSSGSVVDYFTPHDQQNMSANNLDLGAGGPVMLVDQATGPFPHLLISAGKSGTIYVINRDNLGKYNANNDNQIVQSLPGALPNGTQEIGNFSTPVYFNGYVFFGAVQDKLKAFQLTNGQLSATPTSQSAAVYGVRGASFAISANTPSNGILWALQNNGASPDNDVGNPGILFAYDANSLSTELYDSSQAGSRDTLDNAAKFSIPLVANGKVFIAGQTQLTVFGLLP
jgi:hypothetical protein